jgi:hypothetical protein
VLPDGAAICGVSGEDDCSSSFPLLLLPAGDGAAALPRLARFGAIPPAAAAALDARGERNDDARGDDGAGARISGSPGDSNARARDMNAARCLLLPLPVAC